MRISDWSSDVCSSDLVGQDVARVIRADLERSGLFAPIDPKAHIQTPAAMRVQPRFSDCRVLNVDALVTGRIQIPSDGPLPRAFPLWDVTAAQQLTRPALAHTPAPLPPPLPPLPQPP